MGVLGLVPTDSLAAMYDPSGQILTLSASGNVAKWTCGFEFHRLPWMGGLKFELLAWSGPFVTGSRLYTWSQSFSIPNLAASDPDGNVDIITANHRIGVLVPIHWLGFDPVALETNGVANGTDSQRSTDLKESNEPLKTYDLEAITVKVLFKESFEIKEAATVAPGSSLHVQYSQNALTMESSGLQDGSIVWTMNSLETGRTQFVVYKTNGLGDVVTRKIYNIDVIILNNALIFGDTALGTGLQDMRATILDFRGRVFIAERIVQGTDPEAKFLWAKATLPRGVVYPVTDPLRLSQLECAFSTSTGSATITSTGWGEFNPAVFVKYEILGMEKIDVMDVKVGITDAVDAIHDYGIDMAFWDATLEKPLTRPAELSDEPFYVFHMVDGSFVWVGAFDKRVLVNEAAEKAFPKAAVEVPTAATSSNA